METVFAAIADPTRRLILERLRATSSASITDLSVDLPITRQAVTKHLDMLRAAGLISYRKQGRERLHELNAEPLKQLDDWLKPYAAFWDQKLANLQRHLEENPE